jgi:flagellar basal-body rod protein FlgC
MGLFDAIGIAGSGLTAERIRMDVTAENLANADTTKAANGQPYQRQDVELAQVGSSDFGGALTSAMQTGAAQQQGSAQPGGVQVTGIITDNTPDQQVYDPGNPEANAQGYVKMPNVSTVTEMTDLISESQSYQSDVTAMQTAKSMFTSTLELLK